MPLTLRVYKEPISTCLLEAGTPAPVDILAHPLTYFMRTGDEVTLICPTKSVPTKHLKTEAGWIAVEFVGPFAFGETGILAQVANPLAAVGVSIIALATFATDYILIKDADRTKAIKALREAGHTVHDSAP